MVTHLVSLRNTLSDLFDLIQGQVKSRTLIDGFDLIETHAQLIRAELKVSNEELLTEADAYAQARKVTAAMKEPK